VLSGVLNKYHKEKAVLAWMKNNADPDPAKDITFFWPDVGSCLFGKNSRFTFHGRVDCFPFEC